MITVLLLCALALSAAPRIAHSEIDVTTQDGRIYSVRMRIVTTAEAWPAPSHTLERVAGSHLLEMHATLDHPKLETPGAVDRVVFTQPLPANATYELAYSIAVDPGPTTRIALAVPEIPVSGGAHSIQIHITPPDGDLITGDAFPATSDLANFPSHIEFQVSKQPRRSLPALFSDLSVVLLLASGIAIRVMVRSKGSQS